MMQNSFPPQAGLSLGIQTHGMIRVGWAFLFLALSLLTGWMVFVWSESAAGITPTGDILFLVCVACFLSTSVAAAVQKLPYRRV